MGLFRNRNWNYLGFNTKTKSYFDESGFNKKGYDKDGFNKKGYHKDGFYKDGIHPKTKTKFDQNGFNLNGFDKNGFDKYGFNKKGYDKDGIYQVTGTKFDQNGYDKKGYDEDGFNQKESGIYNKNGFNKRGYDKNGFDKNGFDQYEFHFETCDYVDPDGFNKKGYDEYGFDRTGIHPKTKTQFDQYGFNKDRYDKYGFNQNGFDVAGYNKKGVNKNGFDADGCMQFELTSRFSNITSSFNSDFDALVTLAYNEPTKIRSKSFFSHDGKTGIYSKAFESFSNNNVVHFHIEKAGKQYGTIWNKPKDTGKLQGDNFESGYTLIVNFNKNDAELKSILIKKLGKMNFGSLPSEYTLDCHLNEEYPNDERAKELLQIIVELFNSENTNKKKFIFPDILHDVYFQPDDD